MLNFAISNKVEGTLPVAFSNSGLIGVAAPMGEGPTIGSIVGQMSVYFPSAEKVGIAVAKTVSSSSYPSQYIVIGK